LQRPSYLQLMQILIAAAEGNFALYDKFHQSLIHRTWKNQRGLEVGPR
jgi:hypothetical protein